jgi:fucose 4-O-acetylase-like acetyltransferase
MTSTKFRDQFLDIAKGLAIILVVAGHVIQGSSEKFDDLFWFRVIYSFHMPLFVFLSGSVAAIAFSPENVKAGVYSIINQAKTRIGKAAIRLLIPFISWCVINQLIYHHSDSVLSAVALAFRRPDTALWFLLAIFYCITLSSIFDIAFTFLHRTLKRLKMNKVSDWIADGKIQIALMVIIWWAIREHTPRGAGFSLIRPYFIYYILGIGFYRYLYPKLELWKYLPAIVIFIALIPFWDRTTVNNIFALQEVSLIPEQLSYFYSGVVALSGSFVMLGLAKAIFYLRPNFFKRFLILSGQLSLGIYAIHYYFLDYSPKVIAPLLLGILFGAILNKVPLIRTLFLGEV